MKKLIAIILAAILGVALYAAIEQHQELKRQERERAEQALSDCWQHATANGGAGVKVCEELAKTLK